MNEYEAFSRMERASWSDSSRVGKYVELFASAPDQAVDALLDAVNAKNKDRALDVCCGQGNVSEAMKSRGCDVSGLDFSPAMLQMARQRVTGVRFLEADAQDLPFRDDEFDVVVSNFGICHVPDQPRALLEACRVLRPGGRFAMTVWCGPDVSRSFELLYEAIKAYGSPEINAPSGPDFHQFAKIEIANRTLSGAGFSNVELTVVDCSWELERPELLCEIFEKATVRAAVLLANQPSEQLSAIRSALAKAVRERFRDGERWRVPMPAALISARK
ncbi:MAG: class I SAM-dependent methyltransferase [Gemmatimonadaceae bacterium]